MDDLGLGPEFTPSDINDRGEIIGNYQHGVLSRPFFWSERTGLVTLPRIRDHHTHTAKINNLGEIVGTACQHPFDHKHLLMWRQRIAG